jgi:radical SAM superfamily enzyme YgiQ (UPF0313 family)
MARVLLCYSNSYMDNLIPIGVSLLSACLKKEGHETKLFDTTFYQTREKTGDEARVETLQVKSTNLKKFGVRKKDTNMVEDFRKTIKNFSPDLIGISSVESTYNIAMNLLDGIKDITIPKIIGGIHPTMASEEVIKQKSLEMICVGEGEKAIVELVNKIETGQDYSHIRNLWVKKDGKVIKNPLRPLVNLDDIPYQDWDIYEKERFFKPMGGEIWISGPIEFDRGCAYKCAFCCNERLHEMNDQHGKYSRKRSVTKFIDELRLKKEKYGLNYLYLVAENFLAMNKNRFDEFVETYKDIKLPFWIETRPETIKTEKIKKLNEIGCEGVSIGVEHGNEQFRRNILNRYVTNEKIIYAFKEALNSGIRVCANNIIGFPTETRELVFDTINLNRELLPNDIITNIFVPYRGTKLWGLSVKKGYIEKESIAGDYRMDSGMNMPHFPQDEIKGLQRTFPLYVRFPKSRWKEIEQAEKFDDGGNEKFSALSKEYFAKYH